MEVIRFSAAGTVTVLAMQFADFVREKDAKQRRSGSRALYLISEFAERYRAEVGMPVPRRVGCDY